MPFCHILYNYNLCDPQDSLTLKIFGCKTKNIICSPGYWPQYTDGTDGYLFNMFYFKLFGHKSFSSRYIIVSFFTTRCLWWKSISHDSLSLIVCVIGLVALACEIVLESIFLPPFLGLEAGIVLSECEL